MKLINLTQASYSIEHINRSKTLTLQQFLRKKDHEYFALDITLLDAFEKKL